MELYYEAIDTLKGMISRPSFSRDEAAVADFLQQTWQAAGHTVHRKGNNLWIVSPGFDLNKPTLLLNSHIDTVKPAGRKTLSIPKRAKMKSYTAWAAMTPEQALFPCIRLSHY